MSEFVMVHCRASGNGYCWTVWGPSHSLRLQSGGETQAVTLFLGLYLTCHYVQFDSDNAFGEKHELFLYHDNFSFSPYYLD